MPNHTRIYREEAEKYDQLIAKQPNLGPCMEEIRDYKGLEIVDIGAGTGRLTTVLAPSAKSIIALDASESMLQVTAAKLRKAGLANWSTKVADHSKLPLEDQSADLIVAGWTIGYVANTDVQNWKRNIEQVIAEMKRVLRPNGTIIIFETMGTGTETPNPPLFLKPYYSLLVEQYGFSHKWIRTDYSFDTTAQAAELTRFFFGDEAASKALQHHSSDFPECAGIWWLHC
ncbi:ubiquinone/menaquinone biosynthesis C-methylase UbiE [Paenibacillus castaneae]|uniref:class I SAM-dependent methyltransferase n=1 Tax=Paenibacillus castaneae TaxID=474957 RepID=UPI000C9B60C9|nr:class I SAM-dependent methyltransferase [Paenibacillus castaneae]NIK78891.1 ubiquinone/menaquinone biosynthesis C-methylase UbiE [Paenibacillus castaneae]